LLSASWFGHYLLTANFTIFERLPSLLSHHMYDEEELMCLLALQRVKGIGVLTAKRLLQVYGSAKSIFRTPRKELSGRLGLSREKLQRLKDNTLFSRAVAELEFARQHNYRILTLKDPDYPERLRQCPDGPLLLFCKGNIRFNNPKVISVVGSRSCTSEGLANCRQLIADLAPLDPLIISGLAYGIDICAHRSALDNDLQTIACLGHGLDRVYPPVHRTTLEAISRNGGAVTEFWREDSFDPKNFVRRNRIIAGISEATIVVESAERGGSLVTANMANSYNREVFAFPGRVSDPQSTGCNNLIKTERARLIHSAADLIYILGWDLSTSKTTKPQLALFPELTSDETRLFEKLEDGSQQHLDDLSIQTGMPAHTVAGLLINLELKGLVRPLPGKMFERC